MSSVREPLRVVLAMRELAAQEWLEALRARLPADRFVLWARSGSAEPDPQAAQADVAIVWRPPAAVFTEQRALRAVINLGAGVDALLAMPQFPRDVTLMRLEDAGMADALAEYVLTAVLHVYRRFDRYAAFQRAARWQPETLPARSEFVVGVLGLGVIGTRIATTLAKHGFPVRGYARSPKSVPGIDARHGSLSASDAALRRFLQGQQVLVSVLPLTGETRGVLNRETLALLADGAHLINVGRGASLVEDDLLALLDSGKLSGATLDVFDSEPLPPTHPFWPRPEIVITPHASAVTELATAIDQVAEKLRVYAEGGAVATVDIARGY